MPKEPCLPTPKNLYNKAILKLLEVWESAAY